MFGVRHLGVTRKKGFQGSDSNDLIEIGNLEPKVFNSYFDHSWLCPEILRWLVLNQASSDRGSDIRCDLVWRVDSPL